MILALVTAAVLAATFGVAAAPSDTGAILTSSKHIFWGQSASLVDSASNDLVWHGGNAGPGAIGVEQQPAVYLIWWGTEWANGFQTADTDGKLYSSKTLQSYLSSFFQNLGGSPWANIQTQYCNTVLPGSTSCAGGAGYVTNPKKQLKGVWVDATPVPDDIVTLGLGENVVDDPLAQEAIRAAAHFGHDADATYIILTPPRPVATGQPVYCGYHTQTSSINGLGNPYRVQYAFIPWQNTNWPGVGTTGCGMHFINPTSNSFGNGIFDGWSMVTGHEYSEAVTDPDNIASWQDGWLDASGSENADKCAWDANSQNITLGGHQFAVQPTWSNESFDATGNGCPIGR